MDSAYAPSKSVRWISYILSGLPALFLLLSAGAKFLKPEGIEKGLEPIGWKVGQLTGLGILEAAVVIIYLIPRTSVLGAILITGYMGGAIATHVRVGDYFIIVHLLIGVFVWLGLWLREPRLKSVLPLRG